MPNKKIFVYSRRRFIATSAMSVFAINYLPSRVFGANERIRFASIGVGGKGDSDSSHAGSLGDMVALCDCDDNTLNKKGLQFPNAKKFNDYRKMFDAMAKEIDAVTVSTPDHTHAPAALWAMNLGKHVYCQKPLTHDVYQARLMRDTARKMKVATQMGNQGTAENGLRRAVEIIQDGVIGDVKEVHVWTNRPVWPQAPAVTTRPAPEQAPAHVHWNEFLSAAPERPYSSAYHPFKWRGWWDFGTGALGDMGCHTANMAFMALKLEAPTRISAKNDPINPETYPGWATVEFDFPKRGNMIPCKWVWYEGHLPDGKLNLPSDELLHGRKPPGSGSLLVGTKGTLYSPNDYGAQYFLLPEKDFEGYKGPAERLARNGMGDLGMKKEWVEAIKGGPKAFSNFDYAAMLTETILLGNVAIRVGKPIDWDTKKLKVTNIKEANEFIRPKYRPGWMPKL